MNNNRTGRLPAGGIAWLAGFCAVVVLGAGIAGELWLRPAAGGVWPALLPAAFLALTAVLGIVWLTRVRAARRWNAAVDAYAEREIARAQRRQTPKRGRSVSTPRGIVRRLRASQRTPSQTVS
jgi:hypothetical protein